MEIDLRGLSLQERKSLIKWYLKHAPALKMKGLFDAFSYLTSIEEKNPEFTKRAMVLLFEEDETEDDEDEEPLYIPKSSKKDVGRAYR